VGHDQACLVSLHSHLLTVASRGTTAAILILDLRTLTMNDLSIPEISLGRTERAARKLPFSVGVGDVTVRNVFTVDEPLQTR
jgi:hypothetical protein